MLASTHIVKLRALAAMAWLKVTIEAIAQDTWDKHGSLQY